MDDDVRPSPRFRHTDFLVEPRSESFVLAFREEEEEEEAFCGKGLLQNVTDSEEEGTDTLLITLPCMSRVSIKSPFCLATKEIATQPAATASNRELWRRREAIVKQWSRNLKLPELTTGTVITKMNPCFCFAGKAFF
jgi:hypothetical protein